MYYARFKPGGKEIRRSLRTTDRELAKRRLHQLRDTLRQLDLSQSKTTLSDLCDRYFQTVQHQKPKTVRRKRDIISRIKKHWPGGANVQVGRIKPSDVSLWLGCYDFGYASRNLYLLEIKTILRMAVADGIIVSSPAEALKPSKRPKPIRPTPTFEQFQAIVNDIRAQKFNADAAESADFVEFLGLAGLGQAEAGALTWGDIDWNGERIITFRHKTSSGFAIPLYPQLRTLLERLRGRESHSPDEAVFKIKNAKKAISGACKRLGLARFSHRSFRRMFITRAIEKGVDIKVIAEWQGHKDGGKLILDTYSHVNPRHSQRMAKLMTTEQPGNVVFIRSAQ